MRGTRYFQKSAVSGFGKCKNNESIHHTRRTLHQELSDLAAEIVKGLEQHDPVTPPFWQRANDLLEKNNVTTFPEFNKKTQMSESVYQDLKKEDERLIGIRLVMAFCVGMGMNRQETRSYVASAGFDIDGSGNRDGRIYRAILEGLSERASINEWNYILRLVYANLSDKREYAFSEEPIK